MCKQIIKNRIKSKPTIRLKLAINQKTITFIGKNGSLKRNRNMIEYNTDQLLPRSLKARGSTCQSYQ